MVRETLEEAFDVEAWRAVRDQLRDGGRCRELVEVDVAIQRRREPDDYLPRPDWQERVLAKTDAIDRRRRARAKLARRIAIGLLVAAAGLGLGFALQSCAPAPAPAYRGHR